MFSVWLSVRLPSVHVQVICVQSILKLILQLSIGKKYVIIIKTLKEENQSNLETASGP